MYICNIMLVFISTSVFSMFFTVYYDILPIPVPLEEDRFHCTCISLLNKLCDVAATAVGPVEGPSLFGQLGSHQSSCKIGSWDSAVVPRPIMLHSKAMNGITSNYVKSTSLIINIWFFSRH